MLIPSNHLNNLIMNSIRKVSYLIFILLISITNIFASKKSYSQVIDGSGQSIILYDDFRAGSNSHGSSVQSVIEDTAPGANIHRVQIDINGSLTSFDSIVDKDSIDVFSISIFHNFGSGHRLNHTVSRIDRMERLFPNAVFSVSAGNDNNLCNSPSSWYDCYLGVPLLFTGEITGNNYTYDPFNRAVVAGALNNSSTDLAWYSNHAGLTKHDFVAYNPSPTGYAGTSYAAPKVAAAAALVRHKFEDANGGNGLNALQTKNMILMSADGLGYCSRIGKRKYCVEDDTGHGKLNIKAALSPNLGVDTGSINVTASDRRLATGSNVSKGIFISGFEEWLFSRYGTTRRDVVGYYNSDKLAYTNFFIDYINFDKKVDFGSKVALRRVWNQGVTGQGQYLATIGSDAHNFLSSRIAHGATSNASNSLEQAHDVNYSTSYNHNTDVINLSISSNDNADINKFMSKNYLNSSNSIQVKGIGNNSNDCSSADCTDKLTQTLVDKDRTADNNFVYDKYNQAIIVGSRASDSNHAGVFKEDFIVVYENPYSDTKRAAARVAGVVALIDDKFSSSNLTLYQKKAIILQTADGLGSCAGVDKSTFCVDDRYGHGSLNIEAALSYNGIGDILNTDPVASSAHNSNDHILVYLDSDGKNIHQEDRDYGIKFSLYESQLLDEYDSIERGSIDENLYQRLDLINRSIGAGKYANLDISSSPWRANPHIRKAWYENITGRNQDIIVVGESNAVDIIAGDTNDPGIAYRSNIVRRLDGFYDIGYSHNGFSSDIDLVHISTVESNRDIVLSFMHYSLSQANNAMVVTSADQLNIDCTSFDCNGTFTRALVDEDQSPYGSFSYDEDNKVVIVGSLSGNEVINSNTLGLGASNRAGVYKNDYLVAYGQIGNDISTRNAAARVTGVAALIGEKFADTNDGSGLTPLQRKEILLETADGLGSCTGVDKSISCADDIYGHGRLNIKAALSPVGIIN